MKVKLGDLIKPAKVIKCNNGSYPVLSMTMHSGIILQNDRFKKNLASVDQSNYKVVYKGQLVIGFPIDEGVLYIQNVVKKGIMSPAYNIWDINYNIINDKYLELCLHSPQAMQYYRANLRGTTARRRSIPTETLLKLPINLPPLDEQRHIAAVLDKVSDLIALRKKQLAKLDELVKARFVEMFGDPVSNILKWDTVMIGDIAFVTKLAGFEYTEYIKYQNHGDVIMIRGLNVKDKKLKLDDIYYIDSRVSNMLKRSQLKENDIVMTYVGVNIGDVALVDGENIYHLAPNVAKISLNSFEKINPLFLVNLLYFNKEQYALSATNTAKQALNMDKIRKIKIMLPPIKLQNEFVDIIKKVENHKATIKQSLEKLETLKRALMQEYFG